MSRTTRQLVHPKRSLPVAVVLLVVLGLTPVRFLGWVGWFGDLATRVIAPVTNPVFWFARWIAPAHRGPVEDEALAALRQDRDRLDGLYRLALQDTRRLQRLIQELQGGIEYNPDLPVVPIVASVIGTSSDLSNQLLLVRAGRRQGVEMNTVVAVGGVHLVGRVVRAADRTCWVQPITERGAGSLSGLVMTSADGPGLECLLTPTGDGALRGRVQDEGGNNVGAGGAGGAAGPVAVGQTVRLSDRDWPRNAQMLILGMVERVEPATDSPLREVITVRPVQRLDRVSEVILRTVTDQDGAPDGNETAGDEGAGGAPGGGAG